MKVKTIEPITTVVVPSYNSGHFLAWTLQSIADQTLKDFECIVVDDCSTDDSFKTTQSYFKDPRFILVRHKMNVGLSGARNTGLRAARGKFVAFLDSDDLMMSNSLEARVATCLWGTRKSDRFAGSYCGSIQIEEDLAVCPPSRPQELGFIDFVSSNGLCPFNANQPMIRRDVLRLAGGFNQSLKQAEDFDLWQRIIRAGYVFAPANHCSVTYRKRAGSMIRRQPLIHLDTSLQIINSSEQPLRNDQLDWSSNRMKKTLGEYSSQRRKIDRIFEFIGMSMTGPNPESFEVYASIVKQEIPDFGALINPTQSAEALIQKGIRRQNGNIEIHGQHKATELISYISAALDGAKNNHAEGINERMVYTKADQNRPWFSELQRRYDVIFIPHSAYHLWTIHLLSDALKDQGLTFITVDISPEWRDGGVRAAAQKYDIELISVSEFTLGNFAPRALVAFNDWDPITRPLLVAAKDAGISTISIVEGIQDYDDADVHWKRHAYKTTEVVLLPGEFDRKYFTRHVGKLEVVGIPRIEVLRKKIPRAWTSEKTGRVLINSNFSYGVLSECRDAWLSDCVETVLELGMTPVISRHPADMGTLFPEYVTSNSFYDELETCDVSIQRFASGVLEALARELGVIYYNPHGEKVDKFISDPMGAYVLSANKSELKSKLSDWWNLHLMAQKFGNRFLDHHAGKLNNSAISECAVNIAKHMSPKPEPRSLYAFRESLEVIDLETKAFSRSKFGEVSLFPNPLDAPSRLAELKLANASLVSPRLVSFSVGHTTNSTPRNSADSTDNKTAPSYAVSEAEILLLNCAASLLNRAERTLPSSSQGTIMTEAVKAAINKLPKDNAHVMHFQQVVAHVRQKSAASDRLATQL